MRFDVNILISWERLVSCTCNTKPRMFFDLDQITSKYCLYFFSSYQMQTQKLCESPLHYLRLWTSCQETRWCETSGLLASHPSKHILRRNTYTDGVKFPGASSHFLYFAESAVCRGDNMLALWRLGRGVRVGWRWRWTWVKPDSGFPVTLSHWLE